MRLLSLSLVFVFVMFAGVIFSGGARAQESRWIADAHSGCRMWSLTPTPGESIVWQGSCVGGYGQGHGVLQWYVGGTPFETDTGDFVRGKLNGHATIAFADGERFDGEFHGHLPNGKGTLKTSDDEVYSGLWTNGCFDDGKRRKNFGVKPTECVFAS